MISRGRREKATYSVVGDFLKGVFRRCFKYAMSIALE
nr:MAG TPA: hypothetical protein [Caudoviricetes sp.]